MRIIRIGPHKKFSKLKNFGIKATYNSALTQNNYFFYQQLQQHQIILISASVKRMASTSALQFSRVLLLLTFVLLLLQCVVKCVDVGNGHSLKGSEVEVLKLDKSACDFDKDKNGDM